MAKRWRNEAERHAFYLSKKVDKAVRQHNMIEEGDRILVGISGGKDSMSLLKLLIHRLISSPIKYEIVAAHVRGDARGSAYELPESFIKWMEDSGVPFYIWDIITPEGEELPMPCERCARNRRRTLFEMAEKYNCNKVALAHHLEDLAHTALLNIFNNGKLETMAFRRDYFGGKFSVIRPLAYIRENELVRFSKVCEFPIVPSECPMAPLSKRQAARDMMKQVSRDFRYANINLVRVVCRNEAGFDEDIM